jgi:hypothetical protein
LAAFFTSTPGGPAFHFQDPSAFSEMWLKKNAGCSFFEVLSRSVFSVTPFCSAQRCRVKTNQNTKAHFNET